jgi:hypothetical protein
MGSTGNQPSHGSALHLELFEVMLKKIRFPWKPGFVGLHKWRITLSTVAVVAAVIHMLFPRFIPDAITAGLIILAFIPWLSPFIESIDIPGFVKLVLRVGEVEKKQALLQEEVDSLRFLISGFVTEWELTHLKTLAGDAPFDYKRASGNDDRFINEIIRLRDFGLIAKRIDYALYDIPLSGDLKQYVEITERGKTYLKLRQQLQA